MNPVRDGLIVIVIIIGLGIVSGAVRNSGGVRPLIVSNSSSSIKAPKEKTVKKEKELTEKQKQRALEKEIAQIQAELARVEEELEIIELYGEKSPYAGLVKMRKSSGTLRTTDVDREYIQLDAGKDNDSKIVITDWKITSSITGRTVTIPEAVHLVFSGSSGSEQPVVLNPGDRAYITTGRSPIGPSFLVNKCTGYYTQFQKFTPSISSKCPLPEDEILAYTRDQSIFIDNACMDFVDRMRKCRINTKPLPLTLSFTCQDAIIEEINYSSCVDKHKDDEDFRVPDWRIYLKRDDDLWRDKREVIKILDEEGRTVDYYSY